MICVVEVLELIINCVCVYIAKRQEHKRRRNEPAAPQIQPEKHKNSKRNKSMMRNRQKNDEITLNCAVVPLAEVNDSANWSE